MLSKVFAVLDWRAIVAQFHPWASFEYYTSYFETIKSISRDGDRTKRLQIRLIQSILSLTSLAYLVRMFIPHTDKWSWLQVISFDVEGFNHLPSIYHVINCIAVLSIAHMFEIFYLEFYTNPVCTVLYDCLVRGRWTFVFNNRNQRLRKLMLLLIRAMKQGFMIINLFVFGSIIQLGGVLVSFPWFGWNVFTLIGVVVFLLGGSLFALVNYSTVAICNLALVIIVGTSSLFRLRYKIMSQWLTTGIGQMRRVLRFAGENVITLVYVSHENRFYGLLITLVLGSGLPMNGMFIISSLRLARLSLYQKIGQLAIAANQIFLLQFVHYLAAEFSSRLHRNYPKVISLYVANLPRWRLRDRIRLAHNIQAFFVDNRYGLTYGRSNGPIGLITMMAFVKVLFLYSETILYNLKLIK